MTFPGPLAGLDPTEAELAELYGVLAEIDAGDLDYGDPDGQDGDDFEAELAAEMDAAMAELASSDDELSQLAQIGQTIDLAATLGALRMAEDTEDQLRLRPSFEDRWGRAADRLSRGTYLPPQAAYDDSHGCGPLDDFGRCSSRYHAATCFETARGEAANGSAESADAWRRTLLSNHGAAVELSNAQDALAAVGAGLSGPADQDTYQAMRGILGLG